MNEKKMLFFNCPICKKPIVLNVETLDVPELRRIAIKHFDHILLVEYDMHATLRTLTTFKSVKLDRGRKIICPKCQRAEYIPLLTEELDRYAFDHGDHALLIYVIFGRIAYDIVNLIKIGEVVPTKNILRDIVDKVGSEYLASVLTEIIVMDPKIIFADERIFSEINTLFNNSKVLKKVQVIKGRYIIKKDLPISFFKKCIEELKNMPECEALERLDKQLDFIERFIKTLERSFRENPFRAESVMNSIKDKSLKELIKRALKDRYNIEI